MSINKTSALQQILSFQPDWDEAIDYLVSTTEQCEPVIATKDMLRMVLDKYISDEISADELEEWAGFIELCDDIDHSIIEDYLYALSNSELMGQINKDKARQMMDLLLDAA